MTRRTAVSAIGISVAALAAGGLAFVDSSADQPIGGGGGVASLNALTGALDITAGAGISVTPSGSNIQIAATGGGGGDTITSPNSTLNVGGTSSNTTLDINLSNPNSWLALQKFTAAADFSGAVDTGAFSLGTSGSDAVISSGPSGKLYLANAGTNFWYMGFGGNVLPTNDNYNFIGSSALRVASFNGGNFNSYLNAGDTYPATQLLGGGAGAISLLFGPGGASPPNIGFQYANQTGVLYLTSPIAATTVRLAIFGSTVGVGLPQSELTFYGMPGANGEFLYFVAYQQSSYIWNTGAVGGGANRPQIWQSGGSEAFRITTTPTVQMQPTTLTVLGSSTGYTTLTTANASATDYTATFPANTGTVAELNLAQLWTATQTFPAASLTNAELAGPVVTGLTTETAAGLTLTAGGSGVGAYNYTPSLTFGGDISGTSIAATTVAKLQTYALTLSAPSSGQVIAWNGSAYVNTTPSSGGPKTYRQTSNDTTTTSLTSTYLKFSALANTVYYIDAEIYCGATGRNT